MDTITEYFNDLLQAYYNNTFSTKFEENGFKFSNDGIDCIRYVVLKHHRDYINRIVICLYEKAEDIGVIGQTPEIPMYIVIGKDEISYSLNEYADTDYKHEFTTIESEADLFSLRIKFDFNLEYKHLLLLQKHVQLKINGLVKLYYSTGEEKYYGYK